eukprot:5307968-Prymnesium_polylepis.2
MLRQRREAFIGRGACKATGTALPVAAEAEGLEPRHSGEERPLLPQAHAVVLKLDDARSIQCRLRAAQHLAVVSLRTARAAGKGRGRHTHTHYSDTPYSCTAAR